MSIAVSCIWFCIATVARSILRKYSLAMSGKVREVDHDWRVATLCLYVSIARHVISGMLSLVLSSWLSLRTKLWSLILALALKLKSLVLTLMCYGGPDTIDWSHILPDDEIVIRISTNKQGCWPWPWCS